MTRQADQDKALLDSVDRFLARGMRPHCRDAPLQAIGEGINELRCLVIVRQLVEPNPI
jgi:alkylation response protein AidB-like acyl-CoA dehydrogenase